MNILTKLKEEGILNAIIVIKDYKELEDFFYNTVVYETKGNRFFFKCKNYLDLQKNVEVHFRDSNPLVCFEITESLILSYSNLEYYQEQDDTRNYKIIDYRDFLYPNYKLKKEIYNLLDLDF